MSGTGVTQPVWANELDDSLDQSATAILGAVEVLQREVPWMRSVLTEEHRTAGLLIGYPTEPVPAVFAENGTLIKQLIPADPRPPMDTATMDRYVKATDRLGKILDNLTKTNQAGVSPLDTIRALVRRRRGATVAR